MNIKEFLQPTASKLFLTLALVLVLAPILNIQLGISCPLALADIEPFDCRPAIPYSPLFYAFQFFQDPHASTHYQLMGIYWPGLLLGALAAYDFSCFVVSRFSKKPLQNIKKHKY